MKTYLFFLALIGLFIFSPLSINAQDENTLDLDSLVVMTAENATEINELSRLEKIYVSDLAFSPDGNTLASTNFYAGLILWDIQQLQEPLVKIEGNFSTVAFSPNGELLALGGITPTVEPCECSLSGVYLFDTETYQRRALLLGYGGQDNGIIDLGFNPQGTKLVTVDTNITLWDIDEAMQSEILEIRSDMIIAKPDSQHFFSDVIFSSDGALIAYTSSKNEFSETLNKFITTENQIILWDIKRQMVHHVFNDEVRNVPIIAFNHNSSLLASANTEIIGFNNTPIYSESSSIVLWDVQDGQQEVEFIQNDKISTIAFSPDGSLLATGNFSGDIYLYAVESGEAVAILTGHNGRIETMTFSPDGKLLVSSGNATIRFWGIRN
jgi:WD40 repeat protein